MEPKPAHLGLKYAEQFKDSSIVKSYCYRQPYPDEAINLLVELITDKPYTVLDVGCGTGDLSRRLVNKVDRIDAVDFSLAMIEKGKTLSGGADPRLHWIYGRVEEVELEPPYALITAGESLHWLEWQIVLPLFQRSLTPNGYLALVERGNEPDPWDAELQVAIDQFSTNHEFRPYNLLEELESRGLFQMYGSARTRPVPFVQTGEEYIQSIHSRNGFSHERMHEEAANAFDDEVRQILSPFLHNGLFTRSVISRIVWGKPQKL